MTAHRSIGAAAASATRGPSRAASLALLLLAPASGLTSPDTLGAQAGPRPAVGCPARVALPATPRDWPAPLDRAVTLPGGDATLGQALDAAAGEAGVRLSYSSDLVPVDRAACVAPGRAPLGDALVMLLGGTGVLPVVAGAGQVVLAPSRSAAAADAPPLFARTTGQLERVVVTGTAVGAPERASPFAISVLDGRSLPRDATQSLSQVLDGAVPGMWAWTQSPASPLVRYGSVRGASSFGLSAPKVYVDGVEVANPLLLTQLDPSRVQSIEVIRGPQGAALYGADAISGVVNITSRQEGAGAGAGAASGEAHGSAGSSASAFAPGGVLAQDYGAVLRAGSAARSGSLGISASTLGEFVPSTEARQLLVNGSARRVGANTIVAGTAQFRAARTDAAASPLLASAVGDSASGRQLVRQYTIGTTATYAADEHWTHQLIAGLDGYRLQGVSSDGLPFVSTLDAVDSALNAARGGADRATIRLSSTMRTANAAGDARTLTVGVEHSTARERTVGGSALFGAPSGIAADTSPTVSWWSNTGALLQAQVAFRNQLFLSGGSRLEYLSDPAAVGQFSLLPMLGAAWVGERGDALLKLRSAYGRGIRPARTVLLGGTTMGRRDGGALSALPPEAQGGMELGADLLWAGRLALHATRFDQRATGLLQPVSRYERYDPYPTRGPGGGDADRMRDDRVRYELQNVGAIANRGWEFQASSTSGPFTLGGSVSLVSSRVDRLAAGYGGDLKEGSRMLEVPARTYGLSTGYARGRLSVGLGLARATDWINYDRTDLADSVAAAVATGRTPPVGAALRAFWRRYDGVTRASSRVSFDLTRRTALTFAGENLLNRQLGEPDDVTVVPGRTVTLGLRTGF